MSELAADVIDVWDVRLDVTESVVDEYAKVLSADERGKANRFVDGRGRLQYVVSRASIRLILSGYLSRPPQEIAFTVTGDGKPALADPNELRIEFNTSHSGDLALIAVTKQRRVGIDLEQVRPVPKALRLARRFYSDAEYRMLKDLSDHELSRAFFSVWVAREGTAKAEGLSVWRGLAKLATPGTWTVRPLELGLDYVGAVISEGNDWTVARRGTFASEIQDPSLWYSS